MPDPKPKLLLIEVWGLGDLIFTTGFLRRALERYDVTLLAKPYANALLEKDFPQVRYVAWDPPWTAFRGKYRLWRWPWLRIIRLLRELRRENFDATVSVRPDPRDHLVMWLVGARRRYGFPRAGSTLLLNHALPAPARPVHRVENWRQIGAAFGLDGAGTTAPSLDRPLRPVEPPTPDRPEICVHLGARIAVRRWPEAYFREILGRLREILDFRLTVIPDPDGYGAGLADLADEFLPRLSLPELTAALGRANLLLCNDSAPAHIAAALDVPVVALFGPTEPAAFRPWGQGNLTVIRDICPYRPCLDYCRFPEPYCLTQLTPDVVWPEIRDHAMRVLSPAGRDQPPSPTDATPFPPVGPGAGTDTPLRLALSILCENPAHKTGLTTFFHEFVSRSLTLFPRLEWIVFAGPTQEWTVESPRVQVVRRYPANDRLVRRLVADHFQVSADAHRRGADALLTVGFVPLSKRLPTILHLLSLQYLDRSNRVGPARRMYRGALMGRFVRRAGLIITNSQFAARQIRATYHDAIGRVLVSPEGLQHEQFTPVAAPGESARIGETFGFAPGYLLWASNFYPYKQAPLLLAAYARLDAGLRRRHPLVMVGGNWQGGADAARAQAASLGIGEDVRFLGWVEDADLPALYRQARASVLSSREETFGRCVIEAMACGTPCVVNDIAVMHEITGGHALIVDFHDTPAATAALDTILRDDARHARLRADGIAWTQRFSFERQAAERVEAIRGVLEKLRPPASRSRPAAPAPVPSRHP